KGASGETRVQTFTSHLHCKNRLALLFFLASYGIVPAGSLILAGLTLLDQIGQEFIGKVGRARKVRFIGEVAYFYRENAVFRVFFKKFAGKEHPIGGTLSLSERLSELPHHFS